MNVVVAGVSGVVGRAMARQFAQRGCEVVGLARRPPADLDGVRTIPVDLGHRAACDAATEQLRDTTHLVYAALHEMPDLVEGWRTDAQMKTNLEMLQNLVEPLLKKAPGLQRIVLLQGMKAYGVHLGPIVVPARERAARHAHANFYWLQEDWLRNEQRGNAWSISILRPQVVFGEAFGSAMNLLAALGVYAAVLRERGEPLFMPLGARWVLEATDADLLASAGYWCASTPACGGETFNIHNGEAFEWAGVWPTIADALGMVPGPARRFSFVEEAEGWQADWERLVDRHRLSAPRDLKAFAGLSFQYADRCFGVGAEGTRSPSLASTLKARAAGFDDYCDTERMFRHWFARYQAAGWLPPLGAREDQPPPKDPPCK